MNCRNRPWRVHRPLAGFHQGPDLCRLAVVRGRPYQAATAPAPRPGAIEARIYLRAPPR